MGEERGRVAAWVESRKLTVTVLLDATGAAVQSYRVAYTPTVFLVGRDGQLVGRAVGNKSWLGDKGRELFRMMLAP